jgi:hypothetical protein
VHLYKNYIFRIFFLIFNNPKDKPLCMCIHVCREQLQIVILIKPKYDEIFTRVPPYNECSIIIALYVMTEVFLTRRELGRS